MRVSPYLRSDSVASTPSTSHGAPHGAYQCVSSANELAPKSKCRGNDFAPCAAAEEPDAQLIIHSLSSKRVPISQRAKEEKNKRKCIHRQRASSAAPVYRLNFSRLLFRKPLMCACACFNRRRSSIKQTRTRSGLYVCVFVF